jgi:hypothetical protein
MYDFGYQLRTVLDQIRPWSWNFGTVDGIGGPVFKEERDEGAAGIDQEADDDQVDYNEDDGSTAHGCGCIRGLTDCLGGGKEAKVHGSIEEGI